MNVKHDHKTETTSSDMLVQMLTDKEHGQEATEAFFKAEFLASAVDALFAARRQAGLTQEQVAERLNTKQAAIARLEADTTGSMSLHRYIEVALACGMVPLDITLAPIDSVRDYIIECPDGARTADAYIRWQQEKSRKITSQQE